MRSGGTGGKGILGRRTQTAQSSRVGARRGSQRVLRRLGGSEASSVSVTGSLADARPERTREIKKGAEG